MPYRIDIKKTAQNQIARLPRPVQIRIMVAIAALADTPRPYGVRKIAGADDGYRVRVGD